MNAMIEKLEGAGLQAKKITVYNYHNSGKDVPAIEVDTDYEGPYPTEETRKKLAAIEKIASGKRWYVKPHHMLVAVRIYDINLIEKILGGAA